mmetsp:Transcript_38505/g.34062  ORF Transcript_38505/g.34062 Transcript_38505/m.34062 type:complete len:849 (+) Transcript_38505:175-2721(+)|eukprot:CAMPEP_0201573754 /NCGR_PEP_ID=MMETSP0190_2-20130828/17774_1 /ASSEMBLY_ACC=CAM_ASM_000263 /TAXON_ID=37353 /ORGANISM="Rosalina sp." /LENGTH=848 /DNA_ID=CAMNT_0048001087 /DNA_START=177 /DNA_END=2723 /DNA_ORIENTATION=+
MSSDKGWTGVDRWITSNDNSVISEQAVRLTQKGKCSAFGEAVVGSGRAEWDLTIEFESFGGISIGLYRQDLRDRDNINALPTEETFTYTPNGFGYANKTGAFTHNKERKKYGIRYRHGDKITIRLDLQSRTLHFLINDENQGLAYEGLPKGAYRLACCMQFQEQKVSITRFYTSIGKDATIPNLESTKTFTAKSDKKGKAHVEDVHDPNSSSYTAPVKSKVDQKKESAAVQTYADYKEPEIDPDADMFGDDYDDGNDSDVYVPEDSDDGDDDQKLNEQLDALQNMDEEDYNNENGTEATGTSHNELDAVGLIGGRSRGLSKAEQKVPEPLSIESVDEEATDYFSLSGKNLKTDRSTVTCTRQSNGSSSHSAFGTQLVSRGRIEWMIKIDTGHSIRIGVCGSTESVDRNFTETKYGYGYGDDGNIYFGGSHIEYNDGFKAGDIVGVYLNMDMNTLKFSVNGSDHGAAFDNINLNDKDNVTGYRLAVTLQHRPHKLTLLESTLYNVERRSPRPNANQFNNSNNGHQRKLSYTTMNKKSKSVASSDDGTNSPPKKKKSGKKKKGDAAGSKKKGGKKGKDTTASKKKGKGKGKDSTASKKKGKGKDSTASKKKGAGKKNKTDSLSPSKKKGKKASLSPSKKKGAGKKKSTKSRKDEEEEQKSEAKKKGKKGKKEANWVQREKSKDKWEDCGAKLNIEKSSISSKTSIKDGNSAFGKIVIKNKMKAKWDITMKQGDNIGVGVCNVSGGLKTNKNKKLLTKSFTTDMMGYGYMGNTGATQKGGKVKKYGEKFKSGDKVSIILDMNAKSLSFILNGDDQGVAFKNLPSGDYRLAAALCEKLQKITLSKTTIWDAK